MSDVLSGLHAVTVHVRDIEKARSFYRDVLGLHEVGFDPRMSRAAFALPNSSTVLTMHIMRPGEDGREPGTVSGIIFEHADPVGACQAIRQRGGTVTAEPELIELPGAKFFRGVFADPDGNEFVISNRKD